MNETMNDEIIKLNQEITQRINRETHYVTLLSQLLSKQPNVDNTQSIELLKEKLADNNKTIKIIGEFLAIKGSEWEQFYKEKYWNEKN